MPEFCGSWQIPRPRGTSPWSRLSCFPSLQPERNLISFFFVSPREKRNLSGRSRLSPLPRGRESRGVGVRWPPQPGFPGTVQRQRWPPGNFRGTVSEAASSHMYPLIVACRVGGVGGLPGGGAPRKRTEPSAHSTPGSGSHLAGRRHSTVSRGRHHAVATRAGEKAKRPLLARTPQVPQGPGSRGWRCLCPALRTCS